MKFYVVTSVRRVLEKFEPRWRSADHKSVLDEAQEGPKSGVQTLDDHGQYPRAATFKKLFLALWPDPASRAEVEALSSQIAWPARSAVYAPQDWHVTLHFLGDVPVTRWPAIEAAADVALPPVTVSLDVMWQWQRGLLVLGASVKPPELAALHDHLGARLTAAGFALDAREYRPHLTLARRAEGVLLPDGIRPITLTADRFTLVESTGDRAARYRVKRWFGGP